MTDYEFYKEKYRLQLNELSKFPIWTRPQICSYIHISNDTLDKLCNLTLINKFKLQKGKSFYYSMKNDTFTNQSIIKSVMFIDFYYDIYIRYHEYEREKLFSFDDAIDSKSLISRNVRKIGFDNNHSYYHLSFINEINLPSVYHTSNLKETEKESLIKEYLKKDEIKRLIKILKDIQVNDAKESVVVYISIMNLNNIEFLKDILESDIKLFQLVNSKLIYFKLISVEHPQLDEIKL